MGSTPTHLYRTLRQVTAESSAQQASSRIRTSSSNRPIGLLAATWSPSLAPSPRSRAPDQYDDHGALLRLANPQRPLTLSLFPVHALGIRRACACIASELWRAMLTLNHDQRHLHIGHQVLEVQLYTCTNLLLCDGWNGSLGNTAVQ